MELIRPIGLIVFLLLGITLIPPKQVARINFCLHIVQTSIVAVGYDGLGLRFEFV